MRIHTSHKVLFALCLSFSFSFFIIPSANAAQLLPQVPETYAVGERVVVPILLFTEGESVNAIEGSVRYPSSLRLLEIRDGNSLVTFWVERPRENNRSIQFSGITPGGFVGVGEVFSLVFEVQAPVSGSFTLQSGQALLNDGEGTARPLSIGASGVLPGNVAEEKDTTPPDTFTPVLVQDPYLNEGKASVVFATQDKGSGIDHYEVAESKGFKTFFASQRQYVKTQSPYILQDQELYSYIYVKAVDKAGNERVALLSPEDLPWYYNLDVLAGILVVLVLIAFIARRYAQYRKYA